ncbi:MAG: glycogen debranching enzyme, partial [Chlamydiota bacterium]
MFDKIKVLQGSSHPLGLSVQGDTSNFAFFSSHADQVFIALFLPGSLIPEIEFPLKRQGDTWHIALRSIPKEADYAFRCEGPYDEAQGHLFRSFEWLADPYAKALNTPFSWGEKQPFEGHTRARWVDEKPFDWKGDHPPKIPFTELVIYEMHVRGFTIDPSAQVDNPGTFLGIIEKIPY